ncbi:type II toxin-antitoxin system RelE/ParE family toxin (plasmid) [Rhizobium ruizarguesonis]|uniref:Type II toxin-antitoxin system RelE/ParE family toxin n=2 Tax=Rhizobium ruizarguesonis TaxID=2081791 RepID=A0AAE8Q7Y8_9HYPH|nr:type II toxin-antitoxin system RelE/ParE family toxin [Rhizobium ruizarguesonis]MBY5886118.1 type II toxin-antitoxin system RelE/ParE family toxin [Rhizobium leguminosarum]NKL29254.1 type II toxin-antitoxin system mRNA interferase toxin, RelE/StbE family [Rhizobium leguminosarum bv. viciae]MCB2401901.1 type II toxin-antitoxin system RelE/ParE family toxin [Rhizobium ruizarguesonis]NEH75137.1 type II toxin-antitoxin system mRNA interferase toxin, RelE/StbE family [Rhizobium ruizarguesonis]NE
MKLVWRAKAESDRKKAIQFITDQNVGAAISQLDEIERQTDLLIDQPEIDRPGRIDGTRELIISRTSFIVIYRVRQKIKQVEILRLVRGAQKWPPKS